MVITCPACSKRYRIDPSGSKVATAKVKCPGCAHVFEISLFAEEGENRDVSSGQPVVLIVDDARFFREMIKDILKELPVEMISAADGDEAWQLVVSRKPNLVLLDLNIPGKSGKEILQALQKDSQLGEVKVLAMSGVERGEEIASELKTIGADDFISKSFKPRELQDRVKNILGL